MSQSSVMVELSNLIYSKEGIDQAAEILRRRGLDSTKTLIPYSVCIHNYKVFEQFKDKIQMPLPYQMERRLFIPIIDPQDSSLIGFECRHEGQDSPRFIRWVKIKDPNKIGHQFTYGVSQAAANPNKPIILTESVLDAETAHQYAGDLVSPITFCSALKGPKAAAFLVALSDRIILAYDNDKGGHTATHDLLDNAQHDAIAASRFSTLAYLGKDLNNSLTTYGAQYVRDTISNHVHQITQRAPEPVRFAETQIKAPPTGYLPTPAYG